MTTVYISTRRAFEAAHYLPLLPADHKCKRLHGHNYSIEVILRTDVYPGDIGMAIDYADLDSAIDNMIISVCDHRLLNEIDGLTNPTGENIAMWAGRRLQKSLPTLHEVRVWETPNYCAIVFARDL